MKQVIKIILVILLFIVSSCTRQNQQQPQKTISFTIGNLSQIPEFDEDLAYKYIQNQLSFGPRNPNSQGHKLTKEFLFNELRKFTDTTFLQNFTYPGYDGEILQLSNIIASINPAAKYRIMLCAHWDTRPRSDKDPDPKNFNKPIPGANDGASGVAVLLALAKTLNENKPTIGIDIVLFDAEDYGKENDLLNYSIGAKYFVQNVPDYIKPVFIILVDMVGDKDAVFKKEPNSIQFAPDVVDLVWNLANQLGLKTFSNEVSEPIYDDHIPLGLAGMKAINIIDSDLIGADTPIPRRNYWHTQKDTIENISKETLEEIGRLLSYLIYAISFTEK